MVSLWDESGLLQPLFSQFRDAYVWWYPFCFCLGSVPLPRSHHEFSICPDRHWVASGFLGCSVQLDFCFFPAAIPIPTSSSSFRPSSDSSLVSSRSSCLRSILSFWLCVVLCLLFVSSFQFMVLSSFVGHSSSVPSPPLSLTASGSFSFGL